MSSKQEIPPAVSFNPSSEIRLLERVRLQSFHGLLPDADSRVRCPGKHAPVLIEDLLKAEIVSLQLVLAIEEVSKSVKFLLGSENGTENDGIANDMTNGDPKEGSLLCLQNALSQGTNALNQLTNLQISESDMPEPRDTSTRKDPNSLSSSVINDQNGASSEQKVGAVTKRLYFNSDETAKTIWPSDFDTTTSNDDTVLCEPGEREEKMEQCNSETRVVDIIKDTIETLRKEIEELQIKHENQFVAFAGKYWSQEDQCMRKLLEMIMANLSPQDKNWTYHGKFDDHCMEQLFYFVSLQKTLKSCLALLDSIKMEDSTREQQVLQENPLHAAKQNNGHQLENNEVVMQAPGCLVTDHVSRSCRNEVVGPNMCPSYIEPEDNNSNNMQSSSESHYKRMNEFEDMQQHKRLKKSKPGIFACFNTRWSKTKSKSRKKR